MLSDDNTMLILGGKVVSLKDVETGPPALKNIPMVGRFFNTTSRIKVEKNEILLIKASVVPSERSDDVDSKASSYSVANFNARIGGKGSDLLRIYLDLHLEPGQYVEIKDGSGREPIFKQVDAGDIGKDSVGGWPAYASYIDFEIRSNFDLNLSTKRYTKGPLFKHDKWDADFSQDTILGNSRFSKTTLCVSMWRAKLYELGSADDDIIPSLVAVIIKPSIKPQESSAEDRNSDSDQQEEESKAANIPGIFARDEIHWGQAVEGARIRLIDASPIWETVASPLI